MITAYNIEKPPAGIVITAPLIVAPKNYLLCNGGVVSRTLYSALFGAIGTTYGVGNNTTTFHLPDFRGCFIQGAGGGSALGIGTVQSAGLPSIGHTHTATGYLTYDNIHNITGLWAKADTGLAGQTMTTHANSNVSSIYGASTTVTPRNHALNFFIRY